MSNKYYNITFKLRDDVAAEGKSKEAAARSFKWTHMYRESESGALKRRN